jgi:hypothetical protein
VALRVWGIVVAFIARPGAAVGKPEDRSGSRCAARYRISFMLRP